GSGVGSGAVWTNHNHALVIARNAAATRTNLDHFNGRYVDRQAAALLVADEIDLERRHDGRRAIVDGAELCGGASHVEGDDLVAALLLADDRAHENSRRRPRFDDADGEVSGQTGRDQTAVRLHYE